MLKPGERSSARNLQAARIKFLPQLDGIGGEVAERTNFNPLITRLSDLVEESMGWGLVRVVREPDSPRVRRATDQDLIGHRALLVERSGGCESSESPGAAPSSGQQVTAQRTCCLL